MRRLLSIFYYRRMKRLRGVQQAAALLAEGHLEEAGRSLDACKPTAYLADVALYHFVKARIKMEQGDLDMAETSLMASKALHLSTSSVAFLTAVLKARRGLVTDALSSLGKVDDPDEGLKAQVEALEKAIREILEGRALEKTKNTASKFASRTLGQNLGEEKTFDATMQSLERFVRTHAQSKGLTESKQKDAALLLGELLIRRHKGSWLLGLQPSDHRVVLNGVSFSPWEILQKAMTEETDLKALLDLVELSRFVAQKHV